VVIHIAHCVQPGRTSLLLIGLDTWPSPFSFPEVPVELLKRLSLTNCVIVSIVYLRSYGRHYVCLNPEQENQENRLKEAARLLRLKRASSVTPKSKQTKAESELWWSDAYCGQSIHSASNLT
jgi:hypothetical protein